MTGVEDPQETTPTQCVFRPTLNFVGRISGNASVRGQVYMTPDEQVRWSFVCYSVTTGPDDTSYLQIVDVGGTRPDHLEV